MSEWRAWNGLREIKREDLVRVRFRDGTESRDVLPAHSWRWRWGDPHPVDGPRDITAYQKVAE